MRWWPWMISALMAMTALGCRGGGSQELLERELRLLEDEIYDLEDHLEQCHEQTEKLRQENDSLRGQLGSEGSSADPGALGAPDGSYVPPDVELPEAELPDFQLPGGPGPGSLEPPPAIPLDAPPSSPSPSQPSASLPGGTAPPFEGPPVIQPPGDGVPEGELPPLGGSDPSFELVPPGAVDTANAGAMPSPRNATQAPAEVVEISLRRYLAGGETEPGVRGSEGLVLVVEPRDASGQYVDVPGTVAAVLLDPTRQGAEARVARWDFTPDESEVRFRQSALGRGMHFHLEWPNGRPDARMLNLYVRYITADGRELRAEQPVDLEQGEVAEQWLASTRPLLKPAAVATRPVITAPQPVAAAPSSTLGGSAQSAVRPLTAGLWRGTTAPRRAVPNAADPAAIVPRGEPPQTARRPANEDPANGPWAPYR